MVKDNTKIEYVPYFGKQLINNTITNACPIICRSTLFEYGIQFIEDDNVQATIILLFPVLISQD